MVEAMKAMYPRGTRVELIQLNDPYSHIPPGSFGTVDSVDDMGTVHVLWDDYGRLGLVYDVDIWRKA